MSAFEFEFIDEGSMEFTQRGRKSNVPPALVQAIKDMPKGKGVRLSALKVNVKSATVKTDKARIGATIRSASVQAKVKVQILWSPDGVPQIVRK
jgi:hypothetical protein